MICLAFAPAAKADADDPPPIVSPDVFEELEPLREQADPVAKDRLEALALFATARAAQHRKQYERALRLYQRALRLDPRSTATNEAIIPLAFRLKRTAEGLRYALQAVERDQSPSPLLLRRLAVHLTDQGQWGRALELYEKSLSADGAQSETAADVVTRLEMGRLYRLSGQMEQAAECFQVVRDALADPRQYAIGNATRKVLLGDGGETYELIGQTFLAADRPVDALQAFQKANELQPEPAKFLLHQSRVALADGRPEDALPLMQECLAHDSGALAPLGTVPYRVLEKILDQLGRGDQLVGQLEHLREQHPNLTPLGYYLADRYFNQDDFSRAESLYRVLIQQTPMVSGYHNLITIYRKTNQADELLNVLAAAAEQSGDLAPLAPEVQKIIADDRLLDRVLAAAQAAIGETDAGESGDATNNADSESPNSPPRATFDAGRFGHALAAGTLALEAGRYRQAASLMQFAAQADPERRTDILLGWGVELLLADRPVEAAEVFTQGLQAELDPSVEGLFQFYLASALELQGRTDEALKAARKAAQRRPGSPQFQLRPAWVLYHADRVEEAARQYTQTIDRFADRRGNPAIRDAVREARLVLAAIRVEQGKIDEAEEILNLVLDEFPGDIGAMNDLGYLWADADKHLHRAERYIRRAVDDQPENAAYRDSLGWVLYRLGRYEQAVRQLEKAVALDEQPDGVILDHLGDAHLATGQRAAAIEAYRRALAAFEQADLPEKASAVRDKLKRVEKPPS